MANEKNVTTVRDEDKSFIRVIMSLPPERKILSRELLSAWICKRNRPQRRPDRPPALRHIAGTTDCNRRLMLEISERKN